MAKSKKPNHSHKHKEHRLKVVSWDKGKIKSEEFFIKSFDEALNFASNFNEHSKKIYNIEGELVYSEDTIDIETYA